MKRLSVLISTMFIFQLGFCQQQTVSNDSKPFVLGTIHEIPSRVLSEKRIINVYTPIDYNSKDTTRYPVIYLLDGSADEDFIHIAGLVQFCNFPWVDILPKSIVVGIANVDRRRDFTYPTTIEKDRKDFPTTGKSAAFIDFIEKELQPFVERNYKTNTTKTIIGQSLGGLVATEILFKKPQLFTNYMIISPSLWWDNESLLAIPAAIEQPGKLMHASVYIAYGKEGPRMENDARKLDSMLREGPNKNINLHIEQFSNENHASIMHNAIYKGFEVMNMKPEKKPH